ncbi:TLC domain-containing protein 3A-like [Dendropsophus ebraccatus]|uniref:TLC domain-containing protein 3A-like n=1 Tax=Dendropsophus ebraccatus TaxID=150705 RepID=UPI00383119CE
MDFSAKKLSYRKKWRKQSSQVLFHLSGSFSAQPGDEKPLKHWLATTYLWVLIPYMVYDTYVMYLRHWYKCKESKVFNGKDQFSAAMNSLLRKEFLMLVHHIGTLTILVPMGLFIRGDIGDFYVGCLLVAELSTPFVSLGKILLQVCAREQSSLLKLLLPIIGLGSRGLSVKQE